jgi:hypothetical protein
MGLTLTACCGFAGTLSYEMTGTLPFDAPSNAYSGPGGLPFEIKFDLPSQPVPFSFWAHGFKVLANLQYTLGGGPAIYVPNVPIDFFDFTYSGMFEIDVLPAALSTTDVGFSLIGPLMYSGTLAQPTLLAGTFPADGSSKFFVGGYQPNISGVVVQVLTPEPITELLVGLALLGLAVVRRSQNGRLRLTGSPLQDR